MTKVVSYAGIYSLHLLFKQKRFPINAIRKTNQSCFIQVALNIGEKVGPKRNSISANELADILIKKVKKSLREK